MKAIMSLSDRIMVMDLGKRIALGTPSATRSFVVGFAWRVTAGSEQPISAIGKAQLASLLRL